MVFKSMRTAHRMKDVGVCLRAQSVPQMSTNSIPASAELVSSSLAEKFANFVGRSPQPQVILGTQSSSRRAILDDLATQFEFQYSVITADIDELAIRHPDPKTLVLMLAHAKAQAIMKKLRDSDSLLRPGFLVTCDQVVVCNGCIREKPVDEEQARQFIRAYGDFPASTVGACVCTCLDTGSVTEDVDINTIELGRIPEESIDILIREGSVFNCAGGLMVEHPLVVGHIKMLDGTLEGVMGLSKNSFMRVLLKTVNDSQSL